MSLFCAMFCAVIRSHSCLFYICHTANKHTVTYRVLYTHPYVRSSSELHEGREGEGGVSMGEGEGGKNSQIDREQKKKEKKKKNETPKYTPKTRQKERRTERNR